MDGRSDCREPAEGCGLPLRDRDTCPILALRVSGAGTVASGAYALGGWSVALGGTDGAVTDRLASLHEAAHGQLNASSTWGAAMEAYALAYRAGGRRRDKDVYEALVRACRLTHEAYATFASVVAAAGPASADEAVRLGAYPLYLRYFRVAESLGPARAAPGWGEAVRAALAVCMQTTVLDALLDAGMGAFSLALVRDRPDERLHVLAGAAPRVWAGIEDVPADEVFRWAFERANDAMAGAGFEAVCRDALGELVPRVTAELERYEPRVGPVRPDSDASGAPGLFALERVTLRQPRPAVVVPWQPGSSGGLVSAEPDRHLFVTVRNPADLVRRHGEVAGLTGNGPVVVVQQPAAARGDDAGVTLIQLAHPEDLTDLRDRTGSPVESNVSLLSLTDDDWAVRWGPALEAVGSPTVLLDLPFTECVDAWLRSAATVSCRLHAGAPDHGSLAILEVRVDDQAPYLCPCTLTAAVALAMYVENASGGTVSRSESLLAEAPLPIRLAAAHVFGQEPTIGPVHRWEPHRAGAAAVTNPDRPPSR